MRVRNYVVDPKMGILLFSLVLFLTGISGGTMPKSGIQPLRKVTLTRGYEVEWQANFGEKTMDFWISVATQGFVGFGLSYSGEMDGADIIIGGVKNGSAYFQDYHGVENAPVADESQDWDIRNITEQDGFTLMHLRRKFDTGDIDDVPITTGTVQILWAFSDVDDVKYHLETRGFHPINLLDPPMPQLDSESEVYDLKTTVNMTSDAPTLYWCSVHKRTTSKKSHITAFRPLLDVPEAVKHIHHINIYVCKPQPFLEEPNKFFHPFTRKGGQDCLNSNFQEVIQYCTEDLYAWSLGGDPLVFPEEVGLPWGHDDTEHFLVQYHVDNSEELNALVEVGVSLYHTENLRHHEAAMLSLAHGTESLLIPPASSNFTLVGYCSADCLETNVPEHGIHLFNYNLHGHNSAVGMGIRHFRQGHELPSLAQDDTYDFHYQQNRPLYKPRKVVKGDELILECTFDTMWKSPAGTVMGGVGSHDEMCMAFVYYYPRTPLRLCYSRVNMDVLLRQTFGITTSSFAMGPTTLEMVIDEPDVWSGRTVSNVLDTELNWTESMRSILMEGMNKEENHERICGLNSNQFTDNHHAQDESKMKKEKKKHGHVRGKHHGKHDKHHPRNKDQEEARSDVETNEIDDGDVPEVKHHQKHHGHGHHKGHNKNHHKKHPHHPHQRKHRQHKGKGKKGHHKRIHRRHHNRR